MNDDLQRFLTLLGQLSAHLTAEQAAWVLNCRPQDVPILVVAHLLKRLPSNGAVPERKFLLLYLGTISGGNTP